MVTADLQNDGSGKGTLQKPERVYVAPATPYVTLCHSSAEVRKSSWNKKSHRGEFVVIIFLQLDTDTQAKGG